MRAATRANTHHKIEQLQSVAKSEWGRRSAAAWNAHFGALLVIPALPMWTHLNWAALDSFGGSLTAAIAAMINEGPVPFLRHHWPTTEAVPTTALLGYAAWFAFQAFLFTVLPGMQCIGNRTPGGYILSYTANGFLAWVVTHALFAVLVYSYGLDPAIIANQWGRLYLAANVFAFLGGFALWVKAYFTPSFAQDNKFSGSMPFDFAFGVELNPRIGRNWDIKFFCNGRPGIVAWTLIDISFAAYQYQRLGFITNSMIILNLFHAIYVLDFFWNEDWYTRTIDITHDHLGWILTWGDLVLLPSFYTLQAQYLARYADDHLSTSYASFVLLLGLAGYAIFRAANHQRDAVRRDKDNVKVWGRPAQYIRCSYKTSDGKQHESILLTSGWWGIVRHSNYLADLVQSFAMCATCGFDHVLPWSYFIYMTVLLVCRSLRDDRKCRDKYGAFWDKYCEMVPYQIVPGVW